MLLSRSNNRDAPNRVARPIISVEESVHGYQISVAFKNPETARLFTKKFALRFTEEKKRKLGMNVDFVSGVLQKLINQIPIEEIKDRYTKKGMSSLVHHFIKKLSRRKIFDHVKKTYEKKSTQTEEQRINLEGDKQLDATFERKAQTGGDIVENCAPEANPFMQAETVKENVAMDLQKASIPIPRTSAFVPEETGVTYAVIGKSFSGKTYFLVEQLNLLTSDQLNAYTAIIFFTESTSAAPLKRLSSKVAQKMILMDRFCPRILQAVKRINDGTANKFKFLIIFDDILDLRGKLLTKSILTLRNSNISTIISIQYEKILSPAQRSSVHNIYIFNLRTESWEYMLKGYLLGNFKEKLPSLTVDKSRKGGIAKQTPSQIAQILRETLDDYITYYDQRKDELFIYRKSVRGVTRTKKNKKEKNHF